MWSKIKKEKVSYFLLLPTFVIYTLFFIYPLIRAIFYSFYEYIGRNFVYVGLENYISLLQSKIFIKTIINTCLLCIGTVPIVLISSILIANYIARKRRKIRSLLMAMFYLPGVTSIVTICIAWKWIYHSKGILNYVINLAGIEGTNWLGNPKTALVSVMAVLIYICIGYPVILFTAAIGNIPLSLYEVAEIEGATYWQKLWYITLPLIKPTTFYLVVILTISTFRAFIYVILLTGGGPYYSSSVIASYLADVAFQYSKFGLASAIGVILLLIIVILTIIQYKFFRGEVEY